MRIEQRNHGVELPVKKEDEKKTEKQEAILFPTDSMYLFPGICNLTCVNKAYGVAPSSECALTYPT